MRLFITRNWGLMSFSVCAHYFSGHVLADNVYDRLLVCRAPSNLICDPRLISHVHVCRGMNFDNMPELSEGSYPLPFLPGYKLMWFAAACVYTTIIIFVLHTKLLYGAF